MSSFKYSIFSDCTQNSPTQLAKLKTHRGKESVFACVPLNSPKLKDIRGKES